MKDNELMKLVQKVANGEELDASREALYSKYYKSIMHVKSTDLNIRMQRILHKRHSLRHSAK